MNKLQDLMVRTSDVTLINGVKRGLEIIKEMRVCEEHGEYEAKGIAGKKAWSICPQCRTKREAQEKSEREAERAASKERDFINRLENSGIPPRFLNRLLSNYKSENQGQQRAFEYASKFADEFEDVAKTGRSAVFIGKPGTGKTHLACAIAQHISRNHDASFRFITVLRAMRNIKDSWSKESEITEGQAIYQFVAPDLLILDEVGVQFGSEFEKNILFDVINQRYEKRKPTIFISNLPMSELSIYLGERVMDRLREDGGTIIPFAWDSQRGKT